MLNVVSSVVRTAASSTPAGTRTAFSVQSRSPAAAAATSPSPRRPRRARGDAARAAPAAPRSPSSSTISSASRKRVDQRGAHRVVVLASDPVVLEQPQVQIEAAARHQPLARRARHGDRRHTRGRADALLLQEYATSTPHPARSTSWPPSDVTVSTIVSAPCSRAIAASSFTGFRTPVDVSACTMPTTSAPSRAARRAAAADRPRVPTRRRCGAHARRSARRSAPGDRRNSR